MEKHVQILHTEAIEAINRSEVDVSIATAKKFPRSMKQCIDECLTVATMTKETAMECFYALPRAGKLIEGPSVRFAEILVHSWGNINAGFRIIGNDGKKITAQAICHDLEKNVRISAEVERKITNKNGVTFNEDMQIVTGNAAGKIAFRNAVFTCIPKAVTSEIQAKIKHVAIGKGTDLKTAIKGAFDHFTAKGVTEEEIFNTLDIPNKTELTIDHVFTLRGLSTAIKDGTTSINDAFGRNKKVNIDAEKNEKELEKLFDEKTGEKK